jgi:hypothetical protein
MARAPGQVAREVRKASPLVFIVVCGAGGAASAAVRLACFEIGANMVTRCRESLKCVATVVGSHGLSGGRFRCLNPEEKKPSPTASWTVPLAVAAPRRPFVWLRGAVTDNSVWR